MNYTAIDLSDRIKRLKESYGRLPVPSEANPYIDKKYKGFATGDRWITLGYLRGWKKHADAETTRLRAAYAEAEELYFAEPVILDNELLAGHLYLPEYTEKEWEEYYELAKAFDMSSYTLTERPPRKDHIALDFKKLIQKGIHGLKEEIKDCVQRIDFSKEELYPDYTEIKRREFYECLLIELDAVIHLANKYSIHAYELSRTACEPRKQELLEISKIMKRVPEFPAESFREAIQSVQFFLSGLFGLYPLGRPDRYLYELYERDIRTGELTRELAQELIDNFCLCVSDRVFSRAACGFIVGGEGEDGKNV